MWITYHMLWIFPRCAVDIRMTKSVNGVMAAMENRPVREANGAGGWVTKFGILVRTGVGDLAAFAYHQAEQPGR